MVQLSELEVLVLDCQASGATPAHGDLLSLGWAISGPRGITRGPLSSWVVPRSERRISRAVRELTGFRDSFLADALREEQVWRDLCEGAQRLTSTNQAVAAPTLIHFARFELAFLRDLHARLTPAQTFPLDVLCLHEIAMRLLPDLPRRNIRALAGHLGHSLELVRDASGHVLATAFIWHALVPRLAERSVYTWQELRAWLAESPRPSRPPKRSFPLPQERRRALPDRPGVYRFLRRNGDVLYVGKAASLRARVASHFAGHARATERSLEMLTQVAEIDASETPSVLEAALLECDEIKRLDPPYNIHLRAVERATWFATRDLRDVSSEYDVDHPRGPLPSRYALAPLASLIDLVEGAAPSPRACADVLGVASAFLPDEALFREGFALFQGQHLARAGRARDRVLQAASALWLARGRSEAESAGEEAPPDSWDLARVLRRLERNLVQAGLILRRARYLSLLANADVAYREAKIDNGRALVVRNGVLAERLTLSGELSLSGLAARQPRALDAARRTLDIAAYDRLRVLATELKRVRDEGGAVVLRLFGHSYAGQRFDALTRGV
jgi:DNA polymerase III epsilon subunit-like protein